VTYSCSVVCIQNFLSIACRFSCCSDETMSRYAPPADDTLFYQSIHSTPPRRPSAGVSRHDSLPLPTLSGARTDSSAIISTDPSIHKPEGIRRDTSFLWPWLKPAVDFDDREALFTDDRRDSRKVSMKPWEGWRVVLLGSCKSMSPSVRPSF